jgi:hypothetical protein
MWDFRNNSHYNPTTTPGGNNYGLLPGYSNPSYLGFYNGALQNSANHLQSNFGCNLGQEAYVPIVPPQVNTMYPLVAVSQETYYNHEAQTLSVTPASSLVSMTDPYTQCKAITLQGPLDTYLEDEGDLNLSKALDSSPTENYENQFTTHNMAPNIKKCDKVEPPPPVVDNQEGPRKKRKREEQKNNSIKKRKDVRPIEYYIEELLKFNPSNPIEYYKRTGVIQLNSLVGINPKKFYDYYTEKTGNRIKQTSLIQKFDPSRGSNHYKLGDKSSAFMKIKKIKRST